VTGRLRTLTLTGALLVALGAGAPPSAALAFDPSQDLWEATPGDGSELVMVVVDALTAMRAAEDAQPSRPVVAQAVLAFREEPPRPASPATPPSRGPSRAESRTPRPPAPAHSIITPGVVYLTFDDGPDPSVCGQILTILAREQIHATFFVVGQKVLRYPDVARRMVADGHTLGNHSWDHTRLTALSYRGIVWQLTTTQDAVARVTGVRPSLFRPPYGATNGNVARAAGATGLQTVMWGVDPRDWAQPGSGVITNRVVGSSGPGSIILLHCLHPQTAAALPQIIAGLRARGFTFAAL
jgi:peptidoglycan/xylan/chitin deacetylase (PgdA/CDA1 family)